MEVETVSEEVLQSAVARQPRVRLTFLPTPLHEAPRLAQELGGPRILIKREDLTGLALGGNKGRVLEFVMGDALQSGATTIIAAAYAQSNYCRQAAAAAAQLGIGCHLVLRSGIKSNRWQGNLLLDNLLGAHIHMISANNSAEILAAAEEPPDHPWLVDKRQPVILSVGRLDKLKNHPLLLRAFAQLRSKVECRLILLGEGVLLETLMAEARDLGIADDVDFAGFSRNPMAFMRRADVFVLSSDFEGLSNVLIEAMAVGCPVVSTDAPHGPREVLQDGRLGRLVPVGDADGLARAMEETLRDPGDAAPRRQWAKAFSVSASADQYLRTAGL